MAILRMFFECGYNDKSLASRCGDCTTEADLWLIDSGQSGQGTFLRSKAVTFSTISKRKQITVATCDSGCKPVVMQDLIWWGSTLSLSPGLSIHYESPWGCETCKNFGVHPSIA